MLTTTVWLVLQPTRRGIDGKVMSIEVDRMLKSRPTKLGVRDIGVQLHVEVDESLFTVPEPEVTIRFEDARAFVIPVIEPVVPTIPEQPGEENESDAVPNSQ